VALRQVAGPVSTSRVTPATPQYEYEPDLGNGAR